MGIVVADETSRHLESVKRLWRKHSAELGFFPDGAFQECARSGGILVSLNEDQVAGYLLFRIARQRAAIVHLCIAPDARKQGHGRRLVAHLVKATEHLRAIELRCRRDYAANAVWPRLGFSAISEKAGRAADGSELVYWSLEHNHPHLFAIQDDPAVLRVVIDYNVFRDLVERRHEESLGLRADWIRHLILLCRTEEHVNEVIRMPGASERRARRAELQEFELLSSTPERFGLAEQILKPFFAGRRRPQDESDLRHLTRALAGDADAFVTRDESLLKRADEIMEATGLSVVRPAGLIGRLDELEQSRDYQRRFLAGARSAVQQRVSQTDSLVLDAVKQPTERQNLLRNELNRYLAEPHRYRCLTLVVEDAVTALVVVEQCGQCDRVPLVRVARGRRSSSVARALLWSLVQGAAGAGRQCLQVTESNLSQELELACQDLGFVKSAGAWMKPMLRGWLAIEEVCAELARMDQPHDHLLELLPLARTNPVLASQLEHHLWPVKLADAPLPGFVVPIQPRFAEQLFDERLARAGLFGADVDLALNPESVYYRAGLTAGVASPGRVLWYVSQSRRHAGTGAIRACARIAEVVRGHPRPLFQKFRRLGVYDWADVLETAGGDEKRQITAFRFDDVEALGPLPWNRLQGILRDGGVKTQLQGPAALPAELFGAVYAAALDSTKVPRSHLERPENRRTPTTTTKS